MCACSRRAPEQKSFKLYTDLSAPGSVDAISRDTAKALHLKASVGNLPVSGGAISHSIEIYGRGLSIFLLSAPDQQCFSPGLPPPITFHKGIYDVTFARTGLLPSPTRISDFTAVLSNAAELHGASLNDEKPVCPDAAETARP